MVAATLGLVGVVCGAIAAHTLSDPKAIAAVEKAALYQLIHAVVILFVSQRSGRLAQFSCYLFFLGITLFCGSIEAKYLFNVQDATVLAPFGGFCLMLGWLFLGGSSFYKKNHISDPH